MTLFSRKDLPPNIIPPHLLGDTLSVSRHKQYQEYEFTYKWNQTIALPCDFFILNTCITGFAGGSDGKESTCNAGDLGSITELGSSHGGRHGNPLQYSCLENPHGQSLVGYSPWSRKDQTQLSDLKFYRLK